MKDEIIKFLESWDFKNDKLLNIEGSLVKVLFDDHKLYFEIQTLINNIEPATYAVIKSSCKGMHKVNKPEDISLDVIYNSSLKTTTHIASQAILYSNNHLIVAIILNELIENYKSKIQQIIFNSLFN